MALLLKKKHIINSLGEEQELNIYTTKAEAVDDGKPCKVIQVEVDGTMITGYIGCTDELDTPKASSKRVLVDGVEYSERKYMGIKDMSNYMSKTYPDTYRTMTEITEDMLPDTSDATTFNRTFNNCSKALVFPKINTSKATIFADMYSGCSSATEFPQIDTSKGTNFQSMYVNCSSTLEFPLINTSNGNNFNYMYQNCSLATSFPLINTSKCGGFLYMYSGCSSATEFPQIDTSKGTNFNSMYYGCSSALEFPQIDTSKGTNFNSMYYNCSSATSVSNIDFSKATDEQLSGISVGSMLVGCKSLRSITFNNLPIGTTEATLRSKCAIPDTVTEIIMNYRSA